MTTIFGVGLQGDHVWNQVLNFEALVNKKVGSTRHYQNWSSPLIDNDVLSSIAAGKTPLISWHCFEGDGTGIRWTDISAGQYDAEIKQKATELKSVGTAKIFFVIHHEPEDDVDAIGAQGKCGVGPDEFVAAWKHIRRVLRNNGVKSNVQIGVCLMGGTYRGGHGGPAVWIPSTMNPDFIASDGYTRDEGAGQKWKSFIEVFGPAHDFAVSYNVTGKPFIIEECGCAEGVTADMKPAWYDGMADALLVWKIVMLMYSNVNASNFGGQDYRVDTTTRSLTEFKNRVIPSLQ